MDRLERAVAEQKSKKVPLGIVLQPENIFYLTGFFPSSSAVLFLQEEPEMLINPMDSTRVEEMEKIGVPYRVVEKFSREFRKLKPKRIGVEKKFIKYSFYYSYLREKTIVDLEFINEMRKTKSRGETKSIEKGSKITHYAIQEACKYVEKTERGMAAEVEYIIAQEAEVAFRAMVASGKYSSRPHHIPLGRKIDGSPIIVDAGAKVDHYCSDLSRSFSFPGDERQEEWKEIVMEAQKAGIEQCVPGKRAEEVDQEIRKVFREYGVEENFLHSSGHGVGLEVHEPPRLGRGSRETLKEGMVVTVEPGLYGDIGVRVEDLVVVGKNPRIISR